MHFIKHFYNTMENQKKKQTIENVFFNMIISVLREVWYRFNTTQSSSR